MGSGREKDEEERLVMEEAQSTKPSPRDDGLICGAIWWRVEPRLKVLDPMLASVFSALRAQRLTGHPWYRVLRPDRV